MNDILWPKVLGLLAAPPAIIVIVGLLGMFLFIWRRWLGSIFIMAAFGALFALSTPLVGKHLLIRLETPFREQVFAPDKPAANVQAIVVLGGGRYDNALEYGEDTVSPAALERLRYGAWLARRTKLPLLVSGGSVFGEEKSEAVLMQRVLEQDFGVKVQWIEGESRTTFENARRTKLLLQQADVKHVYLVTHAWHMSRALWSFTDAGLDAVPAPMGFTTLDRGDVSALGYIPNAGGLSLSALALRERVGLYWYKSRRDAPVVAETVAPAASK